MMTLRFEQLIARRHFDQRRQIAAVAHRHAQLGNLMANGFIEMIVNAEAIVLFAVDPFDELDDEFDLLGIAHRRHTEQIFDVDDAEAANFHVMANHASTRAEHGIAFRPHMHDVVGDQAMAAHDEIERGFALADATLADHQHTDAEHVDQHAVNLRVRRQLVLQPMCDLVDEISGY